MTLMHLSTHYEQTAPLLSSYPSTPTRSKATPVFKRSTSPLSSPSSYKITGATVVKGLLALPICIVLFTVLLLPGLCALLSRSYQDSCEKSAATKLPLLLDTPPISPKFAAYVQKHCPGYTPQGAWSLAMRGRAVKEDIALHPINSDALIAKYPLEKRKELFTQFFWYLMSQAIEKDQGFTSGAIVCEDPGQKILEFFNCQNHGTYRRISTHFHGRITGNHSNYGVDILQDKDHGLPSGHRTLLFAPINMPRSDTDFLFLKPEPNGARKWTAQWILHGVDFLLSVFKSKIFPEIFVEPDARRERVPLQLRSAFASLYCKITQQTHVPQEISQRVKIYGIAAMKMVLEELTIAPAFQDEASDFFSQLLTYDHTSFRTGNEVILLDHTPLVEI